MALAIKVENLSKAYQLGTIGTGTLSNDLNRWMARVRGLEDPFLKIGEANDRTTKGTSGVVWSLKDINFEIQEGDAVGIIGRNGAGKSTLLKLLSRVTSPTTGNIKAKGRIASLLEVGTGFHPELTGRENVFLNGAILGMRKKEIKKKFDEIVDFSGVERYIDTPVKRYSSGMYVRLAFAVAAYLESEILIVDEVLAVGDAEFQKKCLGKIGEVSKGEGRTVLFVSHNMGAVSQLCTKGILLKNGKILTDGNINDVVNVYLKSSNNSNSFYKNIDKPEHPVQVLSAEIIQFNGTRCDSFGHDEVVSITFCIKNKSFEKGIVCSLSLLDLHGKIIFTDQITLKENNGFEKHVVSLPKNLFRPKHYQFVICLHVPNVRVIEIIELLSFEIVDKGSKFSIYGTADTGFIFPQLKWDIFPMSNGMIPNELIKSQ